MNSELTRTLLLASRGLGRLVAIRSNPNHVASGEHGGEFTTGPGGKAHGKHWAKRQRRKKKRKKTLERLRREGHRDIKEQKATHREQHKDMISEQKDNWKDLKKEQKGGRKEFVRDAKKEHKELRKEQGKERKELIKEKKSDHADEQREMKHDHAADRKEINEEAHVADREHAKALDKATADKDGPAFDKHLAAREKTAAEYTAKSAENDVFHEANRKEAAAERQKELKESLADLRAEHQGARADLLDTHKEGFKGLKEDQATEREDRKASDQEDRQFFRVESQKERAELLGHLKAEIAEKFPGAKRKSARGGDRAGRSVWISDPGGVLGSADDRRTACWPSGTDSLGRPASGAPMGASQSADDPRGICGVSSRADYANQTDLPARSALGDSAQERRVDPQPRMSRSKLHKASSAEAIVAHVLKQRGWTSGWREGRLTVGQRLQLLEDVRQYGRQWMRHEAEAFFGRYSLGESTLQPIEHIRSSDHARDVLQRVGVCVHEVCDLVATEDEVRSLAGRILSPLKRWFDRSRQFVRELIFAGTLALKGAELSAQESDQADQLADVQMRYLDGFEREIVQNPPRELAEPTGQMPGPSHGKPPMSPAQIGARAELYATSAWQGAQKITRVAKRRTGTARWERRILGHPKTEHCTDCPPLAAMGWQPVGTLPDIGESECGPLCLCHFEYSDDIAMPEAKQPKPATKKRKPKPAVVPEAPKPAIPEPAAPVETIQPAPTREEIDIEVKKWIAGEPSRLTVKVKKERAPMPKFELPEGYKFSSDDDRHDNP